jgi:two-component system, NtrC family, phosphoglycerate transport system response regulator PgtA
VSTPEIYLLDDDPFVLRGLNRLLVSAGWRPKQFTDPNGFLSYVKLHPPRVAVLDVWMPRMNGLEVQSRVHKLSPLTRVIMFTGKDDPLVRATSLQSGASAFFLKPFDSDEFLAAIRMAIKM